MALTQQQATFVQVLTTIFDAWGADSEELIKLGRLADNRGYSGAAIDGPTLEQEFEVTLQDVGRALTMVDELKLFLDGQVATTGKTGWEILDVIRRLSWQQ